MIRPFYNFFAAASDLLAPASCGFCGAMPAQDRNAICARCYDLLETHRYFACAQCAAVLPAPVDRCGACLAHSDYSLRGAIALFRYQGVGQKIILRLKRDDGGVLADTLAESLVARAAVRTDAAQFRAIDLVIPIPQRPRFPWEARNYAPRYLAESLARRLACPALAGGLAVRKWLRRQHELTARQRLRNMRRAFRVRRQQDINGRVVLVVDDVMTSGATLLSAAQTLLDAGAREVWGAVAARGQSYGVPK